MSCPIRWSPLVVLALLLPAGPALAQSAAPVGTLDATGYDEIAQATPFRIRKPDASQVSDEIAGLFREQLQRRGYSVANTGVANVLSFRVAEDVSGEKKDSPLVEIRPRERNPSHDDEATSVLLLERRGIERPKGPRQRPHVFEVEIVDLQGRPLWSARVTPLVAAENDYLLASRLVPPLLDRLGETVQGEDLR